MAQPASASQASQSVSSPVANDWVGLYREYLKRAMPLSPDAEREQVALMKAGDERARLRLWQANLRWALHIARWYRGSGAPSGELVQVAVITLWNALPSVDLSRGALRTHLTRPIMREVRTEADRYQSVIQRPDYLAVRERRAARLSGETPVAHAVRTVSLSTTGDTWLGPDGARRIPERQELDERPSEEMAAIDARLSHVEAFRTLIALVLDYLTPREQTLIVLRYERELDFATIATEMGYSSTHAAQMVHWRALEKLRQAAREQPEVAAALLDVLV